jgi:endonuclease/exonuclease/phosphatase family metal-dependent hydrolase
MHPSLVRPRPTFAVLAVLAAAVLAACGAGDGASADAAIRQVAPANSATIMTRNLYVGGDVFLPFVSPDPLAAAAQVWADILASAPSARMAAIADEIALARPNVVGLQEAYRFEVALLGETTPIQVIDFLDDLEQALAALPGAPSYTRAATQTHTVVTVPFPEMVPPVQVTLIDRDAILVDESVDVGSTGGGNFQAEFATTISVTVLGVPVEIAVHDVRGWVQASLTHEGVAFTFVSTHLEVQEFGPLQSLQALELAGKIGTVLPLPLVVVGDTNSGPSDPPIEYPPGSGTFLPTPYSILTSALADAWTGVGGFTCCFDADITVPSRPLYDRVDLVLTSPGFGPTYSYRIGFQPLPSLAVDGALRWPSDHAGVVSFVGLPEAGAASVAVR